MPTQKESCCSRSVSAARPHRAVRSRARAVVLWQLNGSLQVAGDTVRAKRAFKDLLTLLQHADADNPRLWRTARRLLGRLSSSLERTKNPRACLSVVKILGRVRTTTRELVRYASRQVRASDRDCRWSPADRRAATRRTQRRQIAFQARRR